MSEVTPFSSYHAASLTSSDRKSAGGGHREDYRGGELEEEEEEENMDRDREGWEVKERENCRMIEHAHSASSRKS